MGDTSGWVQRSAMQYVSARGGFVGQMESGGNGGDAASSGGDANISYLVFKLLEGRQRVTSSHGEMRVRPA